MLGNRGGGGRGELQKRFRGGVKRENTNTGGADLVAMVSGTAEAEVNCRVRGSR